MCDSCKHLPAVLKAVPDGDAVRLVPQVPALVDVLQPVLKELLMEAGEGVGRFFLRLLWGHWAWS